MKNSNILQQISIRSSCFYLLHTYMYCTGFTYSYYTVLTVLIYINRAWRSLRSLTALKFQIYEIMSELMANNLVINGHLLTVLIEKACCST